MALKLVVDQIDDVEETMRPLYEEKDGKFHLIVEGIEDTSQIKRNLEAARRSEKAMKHQVEKWEKLGLTEEEILALKEKAEKDVENKAVEKGEWDKLKTQMNEKHAADIKKWELLTEAEKENNKKLKGKIERYLVDAKATAAITAAEGEPELLLAIVKRHIKVDEDENGEYTTSIVNDKGEARVNGKGEPLTIDELLAEMKSSEKLGRAFKASGNSGAGSAPGGGSNSTSKTPAGVPKSWQEAKTPEDKAKYLAHQKTVAAKKTTATA